MQPSLSMQTTSGSCQTGSSLQTGRAVLTFFIGRAVFCGQTGRLFQTGSLQIDTFRRLRQGTCHMLLGLAFASSLPAAEKAAAAAGMEAGERNGLATQYIEGLRKRGWHDTVLETLDRASEDPLASSEFLKRVALERAITWAAMAKQTPSRRKQAELISQATSEFLRYAEDDPNTRHQVVALSQAGDLLQQQARSALAAADRLPQQAGDQRQEQHTKARSLMNQASEVLAELLTSCASQLKSLPKAVALQNDPAARSLQALLENKQAETQFQLAKLQMDRADTYAQNSSNYTEALQAAAKDFKKLQEDYKDKLIGFYGRLYEGRCHQQLGQAKKALSSFDNLIDQPIDHPDFRRLVARAYRYRAELHLEDNNFEKAIEECREWLNHSRNDELEKPEWLAVMFRLANAYEAQALTPAGSADAHRLRSEAMELLRKVARNSGEFQRQARAAIAPVGGSSGTVAVRSFDDAFSAGKEALDQMNSSQLTAKLAAENNPSAVGELQQQVTVFKSQAIHYYETCLKLTDRETPLDQLISARYSLCWLYWEADRPAEAALIGEFLAQRYPENQFAPVAAKLALAAYERMYHAARQQGAAESTYEGEQLTSMAQLLISRWPESEDAAVAMNLLLNIALRGNRVAEAEAMLERLPAASRAGAELSLGGSLWTRYLQSTSSSEGPPTDEQQNLKQRAIELLSGGFDSIRKRGDPNSSEAVNVLYLSQALLAEGQFERAVEVLEDPRAGPLTLVQDNAAAAKRKEYVLEVYKAALRAFVSIKPPQREKAQRIMESLESTIPSGANAGEQLTRIYLSLGRQLQRQINELSAAGKAEQAQDVAGAFGDLVKRVTAQGGAGENWKLQKWIAQTNHQLGKGLRGQSAQRYYGQAESAWRALLAKAAKDPKFAPSEIAVLVVRKQLGDCLQAQEKFAEAFDEYTTLLKQKPTMLELQQAAALALQAAGRDEKNPEKLEQAIRGALPQANNKNLVWGWLRLATIADSQKRKAVQTAGASSPKATKYHDLFFAARLQVVQARFASAELATGEKRKKQLDTAKQSLKSMQQLYPELGGPRWKSQYLELLKKIESASP